MEIHAKEMGSPEEELLLCPRCGSSRLEPLPAGGTAGVPSWSLMTRFAAKCLACGRELHRSWEGRVRFRYVRSGAEAPLPEVQPT